MRSFAKILAILCLLVLSAYGGTQTGSVLGPPGFSRISGAGTFGSNQAVALVDMLVSGAGTGAANGTYTLRGTFNAKNFYNLLGSGTDTAVSAIHWTGTYWEITDTGGTQYYYSTDNVATPNLVTTWILFTGVNPLPTVTLQ